MLLARLGERAGREELPDGRHPGAPAALLPDPEGLQPVVAMAGDRVGRLAAEHVRQMGGAKTLARAHDRRERLLRIDGGVVEICAGRCRDRTCRKAPVSSPK